MQSNQIKKNNEHFHTKRVLQKAEAAGQGHYYEHRISRAVFPVYLGTAESNSLQLFAQGSCQWDWAQGQGHRLKLDLEGKKEFLPMGVSSLQR